MSKQVYKDLLGVMQKRGGGYPGMDIPEFYAMVEELFTPEQAEVNNAMPAHPTTAKAMAEAMGRNETEMKQILESMGDAGLCTTFNTGDEMLYIATRFMIGILEFQFSPGGTSERDKKIARLIHDYKRACNKAQPVGPIKAPYPGIRVITVGKTINPGNPVHTYDQVQSYIDKYDDIALATCYCRHEADLLDEDLHGIPKEVCMSFGPGSNFTVDRLNGRKISREEARDIIDLAEEQGLVHMSSNTSDDIGFICNCDRYHCEAIKSALRMEKPGRFFTSGFQPQFDADSCTSCEECIDRCPATALVMGNDDLPEVDLDQCFGCAACATGCPSETITMISKTGFSAPPKNNAELAQAMKAGLK
ncbi:MAG: 4Fe-4S dicluster domain-containing protein [Candidatus Adiutricales bacterium]